jgi:arginine decarboxylase
METAAGKTFNINQLTFFEMVMTAGNLIGNMIPNNFFVAKGSGESDLEKHAGSYHMALYDAGIADFNIMSYSSVIPATARLVTPDEIDLPPFGSELKTIMSVSHGYQDEFVSAGIVYAWMYRDEDFDDKVGGLVCEVSGRYRIEELESRLIRVINDLHQKTYGKYYLGDMNFITEGITIEQRYGTAVAALCFVNFLVTPAE